MNCTSADKLFLLVSCALVLVVSSSYGDNLCKWVDEDGATHYAESCPEGVNSHEVEIQAPPGRAQADEASSVYADPKTADTEPEEEPAQTTEWSSSELEQMKSRCVTAMLNLDALSQGRGIYYDSQGQLQADLYQSVRYQYDRSARYLDAKAMSRSEAQWRLVEQDNCVPDVLSAGVSAQVRQKKKSHLQGECGFWKSELEYLERSRGFRRQRTDLKKLFNANCR
jgi:hypothetical protein